MSFIVYELSGIMLWLRVIFLFVSVCKYCIIDVLVWYCVNVGCVRNFDVCVVMFVWVGVVVVILNVFRMIVMWVLVVVLL